MSASTIYIIEPDVSEREQLRGLLASTCKNIETFGNAQSFLAKIGSIQQACLIAPASLPDMNARELISRLKREGKYIPVIVLGEDFEMPRVVSLMRAGAADFIERPISKHRLKAAVQRVLK